MISERKFAAHFSNFWREELPNLESVTRSLNLGSRTLWKDIAEAGDPGRRDLISETGFETACMKLLGEDRPIEDCLLEAFARAGAYVSTLRRGRGKGSIRALSNSERAEVIKAAKRILGYINVLAKEDRIVVRPAFRGHGLIDRCHGDFEGSNRIIEIKYVDRNFRSVDVKQVIVYACLRYFESRQQYVTINLVNMFKGLEIEANIGELIKASGSDSFEKFAHSFSYFVSSGEISH